MIPTKNKNFIISIQLKKIILRVNIVESMRTKNVWDVNHLTVASKGRNNHLKDPPQEFTHNSLNLYFSHVVQRVIESI